MTRKSTLAVVIPVHNRREELTRALRSVYQQTLPVDEVWVMDDASDVELFPLEEFKEWSALHYHRLESKSNANVARNKGAHLSQSDYIAFLDSDDEWEVDYIEQCKKHLKPIQGAYFSQSKIVRSGAANPKHSKEWREGMIAVNFLLDGGFAQTSSFIVDRVSFLNVQFDEQLKRHQDFDFFARYAKSYHWQQLPVCAVLVHWEENRKATRDARSEMIFIERFVNEIEPRVLKRYLRMQYDYFYLNGSSADYKLHQAMVSRIAGMLNFSEFKSFYKERSILYLNTIGFLTFLLLRLKSKF
jgi:glycosyltransferase involved in cell wall biosynthesis